MAEFPGVVTNKANFVELFSKAWEKSMTKSNIESGFTACGIVPFNPSAVPLAAYLPNYLYSVDVLEKNPVLMDQLEDDDIVPTVLSSAADHSYSVGLGSPVTNEMTGPITDNQVYEENLSPVNQDKSELPVNEDMDVALNESVIPEAVSTFDDLTYMDLADIISFEDYAAQDSSPEFHANAFDILEIAMDSVQSSRNVTRNVTLITRNYA